MIEEIRGLLADIWNAIEHNPGFWAIIGVVVGIICGEGLRFIRWSWQKKSLRKSLLNELSANLGFVDSRKTKIAKMLKTLDNSDILSGHGLPAFTMIYDNNKTVLVQALSADKLHAIQMIYEPLKDYDQIVLNFHERLMNSIKQGILLDPKKDFGEELKEVLSKYDLVRKRIEYYLKGRIEEILNGSNEKV